MNKRLYIFIIINLLLSIIIANIYSIKLDFSNINNNKLSIKHIVGINNKLYNDNYVNSSVFYQVNDVVLMNSFNYKITTFHINYPIKGIYIIQLNNILNKLTINKITNCLNRLSHKIGINIFFINLITIFMLILAGYIVYCYLYKIIIKLADLIIIREDKIKTNNYVSIGLLFISLLLFSSAYFTNFIPFSIFSNSDELFLFDVFISLRNGVSLNDWYLPGAFQFFPSMPILAIIYLFTHKIYYIAYYYAIIQILVYYFVIVYFLNVFLSLSKSYYLASILTWMAVFCAIYFSNYNFLFIHSCHFETFIITIFIFTQILQVYKYNKFNKLMLFCFSIVQILGIMSDRWLVIWLVMPILSCLTFLYTTDLKFKNHITIKLILILLINTLIAIIFYKSIFINNFEPTTYFIFQNKIAFFQKVAVILTGIIVDNSFNLIMYNIIFLVIILSLKFNSLIRQFYLMNNLFKMSVLFSLILFIINYLALIFVTYFVFNARYLIPIDFLIISVMAIILYNILGNSLSLILIGLLSLGFLLQNFVMGKVSYDYYPNDIKCLDTIISKYNLKYGIAEYWTARNFSYINKSNADIVPINQFTHQHFLWMENQKHDYKNYDFALINNQIQPNLIFTDIVKLNGNPDLIGRCNNYDIVIYKHRLLKHY